MQDRTDLVEEIERHAAECVPFWSTHSFLDTVTTRSDYKGVGFENMSAHGSVSHDSASRHYEHRGGDLFHGKYRVFRSGGYRSDLTYFLTDEEAWSRFVREFFAHLKSTMSPERRFVSFIGSGDPRHTLPRLAASGSTDFRYIDLQGPLEKLCDGLDNVSDGAISTYGSCMDMIVQLHRNGFVNLSPSSIQLHTDAISEEGSEYVRRHWNIVPRTLISATEFGVIGSECRKGVLHFNDNDIAVRKRMGQSTLTNLHNFAQPIINYSLPGGFTMRRTDCVCGLSGLALELRQPRIHPVFQLPTRSGRVVPVHAMVIRGAVDARPEVDKVSLWQRGKDLHVAVDSSLPARQLEDEIRSSLRRYCGDIVLDSLSVKNGCFS